MNTVLTGVDYDDCMVASALSRTVFPRVSLTVCFLVGNIPRGAEGTGKQPPLHSHVHWECWGLNVIWPRGHCCSVPVSLIPPPGQEKTQLPGEVRPLLLQISCPRGCRLRAVSLSPLHLQCLLLATVSLGPRLDVFVDPGGKGLVLTRDPFFSITRRASVSLKEPSCSVQTSRLTMFKFHMF